MRMILFKQLTLISGGQFKVLIESTKKKFWTHYTSLVGFR